VAGGGGPALMALPGSDPHSNEDFDFYAYNYKASAGAGGMRSVGALASCSRKTDSRAILYY
jgi:hypothetical protein